MNDARIQAHRMSPQQERLWLLQQKDLSGYGQIAVLIEGPLDHGRLEEAVAGLVRRHEILRTTFRHQPGLKVPLQVVAGSSTPVLQVIDLTRSNSSETALEIDQLLQSERQVSFDYAKGPLARFAIVKLTAHRHILTASVSALCTDAWSLNNLARQLAELYESGAQSEDESDDNVQYAAYASWQIELLEGDEAEAGRTFWKKQNLLSLPPVHLPYERKTGVLGSSATASVTSALDRRKVC